MVDDARLRRQDVGGAGRIAGAERDDARRQGFRDERQPAGPEHGERAHAEEGTGIRHDAHRHLRGRAIGRRRRDGRRRKVGAEAKRHPRHLDGDPSIVMTRAPQRVDEARQVGLRAAHEGVGIRRGVGAKTMERGGSLQSVGQGTLAADHVDGEGIGQRVGARRGRTLPAAEEAERIEIESGRRTGAEHQGDRHREA
jgi:hypothetical protein